MKIHPFSILLPLLAAAFFLTACEDDEPVVPDSNIEQASDPVADGPIYDKRYCEVLLASLEGTQVKLDAYNSVECNECPAEQWDTLDMMVLARENNALMAIPNGPRFFTMDSVSSSENAESCAFTFGDIDMTYVASIYLDGVSDITSGVQAYAPSSVARQNVWHFRAGREVFLLENDQNECFIMQSYNHMVDSTLRMSNLRTLGDKLVNLPAGWSYRTDTLEADLDLNAPNFVATIMNDELDNVYQMLHNGCLN